MDDRLTENAAQVFIVVKVNQLEAAFSILEKLLFFQNSSIQPQSPELRHHHYDRHGNFQTLQANRPRDLSGGRLSDFRKTPVFLKSTKTTTKP
ncbi:MAG: hypothetical protein JNN26_13545 [Candidatus Obscuribacter sp.]|nr:hypothetical protein [Candidatus Obscuribacter sp.]